MRYRMLGIDLDGTLLGDDGEISEANRQAIGHAVDAGVLVVPCTGRSWCESHYLLNTLEGIDTAVFVTGAAVGDVKTGESVDLAEMEPHVALAIVESLWDVPEAILVFRDRHQAGHDYLVTGQGELTPNTEWWFELNDAKVHHAERVDDGDMHFTLRVGLVATLARMEALLPRINEQFGDRVFCHHFMALQMPDPSESMHILEIFAAGVDKWRGLRWIADRHDITDDQIAVIGDEINDRAMIERAGCGIAMGNAKPSIKEHADRITRSNQDDGVAHAIDQLLAGNW